jgi:hypothetical protein
MPLIYQRLVGFLVSANAPMPKIRRPPTSKRPTMSIFTARQTALNYEAFGLAKALRFFDVAFFGGLGDENSAQRLRVFLSHRLLPEVSTIHRARNTSRN